MATKPVRKGTPVAKKKTNVAKTASISTAAIGLLTLGASLRNKDAKKKKKKKKKKK